MAKDATHSESELKSMKRPELQKLAKTRGIKGNLKNDDLIAQLAKHYEKGSQNDTPTDAEAAIPPSSIAAPKDTPASSDVLEEAPQTQHPGPSQATAGRPSRKPAATSASQRPTRGTKASAAESSTTRISPRKGKEKAVEQEASPEELDEGETESKSRTSVAKPLSHKDKNDSTPEDSGTFSFSTKPLSDFALPSASQISDISDILPPPRSKFPKGTTRKPLTRVDTETGEEIPFASQRRAFPPLPLTDSQPSHRDWQPTRAESEESDLGPSMPTQKQSAVLTSLESGVSHAHRAIDNLEKSQKMQAADIVELQDETKIERARMDEKERELTKLEKQLKANSARFASIEKGPNRVDTLEKRVAAAEKDAKALSGVLNEQKRTISALYDLVYSLKRRLEALESTSSSRVFASPAKIPSSFALSENRSVSRSHSSPPHSVLTSTPVLGKRQLDDADVSVTSSEEADASLVLEEPLEHTLKKPKLNVYNDQQKQGRTDDGLSVVGEEEEPLEDSQKENKPAPDLLFQLAPPVGYRKGMTSSASAPAGSMAAMKNSGQLKEQNPISALPVPLLASSYVPPPASSSGSSSGSSRSNFAVRNNARVANHPYVHEKAAKSKATLASDMPPPATPGPAHAELPSSQSMPAVPSSLAPPPTLTPLTPMLGGFRGMASPHFGSSSSGYATHYLLPTTPDNYADTTMSAVNTSKVDRMLAAADLATRFPPPPVSLSLRPVPPTPVVPSGTFYGTEMDAGSTFGDYVLPEGPFQTSFPYKGNGSGTSSLPWSPAEK